MDNSPPTIPWDELSKPLDQRKPQYRGRVITRPERTKANVAFRRSVPAEESKNADIRTAKCTVLPDTDPPAEPKKLSECDSNPVLNSEGAAFILGVSTDLLKKWRQRRQGPDYIQYGPRGLVRYELSALLYFRDYYGVYLNSKRYGTREATPRCVTKGFKRELKPRRQTLRYHSYLQRLLGNCCSDAPRSFLHAVVI